MLLPLSLFRFQIVRYMLNTHLYDYELWKVSRVVLCKGAQRGNRSPSTVTENSYKSKMSYREKLWACRIRHNIIDRLEVSNNASAKEEVLSRLNRSRVRQPRGLFVGAVLFGGRVFYLFTHTLVPAFLFLKFEKRWCEGVMLLFQLVIWMICKRVCLRGVWSGTIY